MLRANVVGWIRIESVQLSQYFQPVSDRDRVSPAESAFSASFLLGVARLAAQMCCILLVLYACGIVCVLCN